MGLESVPVTQKWGLEQRSVFSTLLNYLNF